MPQLDSVVLYSQAQLVLYFFFGFYFFIYAIMPIVFVALSISNEFHVYKYYKHQQNLKFIENSLVSLNGNTCYSLLFVSQIDKYKQTNIRLYID